MREQAISLAGVLIIALMGRDSLAQPSRSLEIESDVVYGHKDGLALTLDVYRPGSDSNRAAILFMVSGGWRSQWTPPEAMRPRFQPYLDQGYTVVAVRHGSSPRYSIPEAVSDVKQAVRFVRKNAERFDLAPDRLGAMGNSAGGHLALMLGTTGTDEDPDAKNALHRISSRIGAAVARVPPTDLRVAVWESPESLPVYRAFPALNLPMEEAEQNSPLVHATEDDAPSLVIMGADDKLVPAKHGRWIEEALRQNGVKNKLIIVPGAGHGLQGAENQAMIVKETIDWFDRFLVDAR
jgi:acetyl esterase/lipase